jgi:hypothetical protein
MMQFSLLILDREEQFPRVPLLNIHPRSVVLD